MNILEKYHPTQLLQDQFLKLLNLPYFRSTILTTEHYSLSQMGYIIHCLYTFHFYNRWTMSYMLYILNLGNILYHRFLFIFLFLFLIDFYTDITVIKLIIILHSTCCHIFLFCVEYS